MSTTKLTSADKRRLVQKIVGRYKAIPQDKPLAIFAAGIPGSGKTEFLDRLFKLELSFVRIDLDEIVKIIPGYTAATYYEFRGAATVILDELFRYCRKHRLNFVLDGTFGHKYAVDNIEKAVKHHEVTIFYIWKNPVSSWQLTKDREEVTKRAIKRTGFIEACINVPKNLQKVRKNFGDQITIIAIKKNDSDYSFEVIRDTKNIDELLLKNYTVVELEKDILWIYYLEPRKLLLKRLKKKSWVIVQLKKLQNNQLKIRRSFLDRLQSYVLKLCLHSLVGWEADKAI